MLKAALLLFVVGVPCLAGVVVSASVSCTANGQTQTFAETTVGDLQCQIQLIPGTLGASATVSYSLGDFNSLGVGAGAGFDALPETPRDGVGAGGNASITVDLFTPGPVRNGLMYRWTEVGGQVIGGGGGFISTVNNHFGTRPTEEWLPFTLGTEFSFSLAVSAGVAPKGSEAGGFADRGIYFVLYEMNPDGSAGAIVDPSLTPDGFSVPVAAGPVIVTNPEPGTAILLVGGALLWARRGCIYRPAGKFGSVSV